MLFSGPASQEARSSSRASATPCGTWPPPARPSGFELVSSLPHVALRKHVAASKDCPGGGEEAGPPEEADPEGARYRFPGYGVAGEVEPGLELVGEQVGVKGAGETEAGGEPEKQDENHGAHARAHRVVGSDG